MDYKKLANVVKESAVFVVPDDRDVPTADKRVIIKIDLSVFLLEYFDPGKLQKFVMAQFPGYNWGIGNVSGLYDIHIVSQPLIDDMQSKKV
jgi:hypothetical protein